MVKVLYVEDESAQRELMTQLLQSQGFEVKVAKNGAIGIEKARAWSPDVILMDLRMPYMDGFEAIRQLRGTAITANIPIVVISAWTTSRHEKRALELGANQVITKPYDLDEIVTVVLAHINDDDGP